MKPTEDQIEYYMSEACAYFALALNKLTGYQINILIDEAHTEEWGGIEFPTIAHVFVGTPHGTAIDVKGERSIGSIKEDFYDLDEPRVIEVSPGELKREYMGDELPLFAYRKDEVDKAEELIKELSS